MRLLSLSILTLLYILSSVHSAEAHRPYLVKDKTFETPKGIIITERLYGDGIVVTDPMQYQIRDGKGNVLANTKTYNHITEVEIRNKKKDDNVKNKKKMFNFYSAQHEGHILLALKLFNENKIFGIGPQGFKEYCKKVNQSPEIGICSTHPHNILIQIILELGLIGLFFYILAAVFVLFHFFKSIFKRKFSVDYLAFYAITLGLIINLFPLIPGGNFFNNWISIILYYNVGLYMYSYKNCILNRNN